MFSRVCVRVRVLVQCQRRTKGLGKEWRSDESVTGVIVEQTSKATEYRLVQGRGVSPWR